MTKAFDAALVTITRKRFSTTQGEVLVEYDGQRIEQYGDEIKLVGMDWVGRDDSFWIDVAKREAIKRGMAFTKLPSILAEDFCADHVEDIPLDIRESNYEAIARVYLDPEGYPNADWHRIAAKRDAILKIGDAWFR